MDSQAGYSRNLRAQRPVPPVAPVAAVGADQLQVKGGERDIGGREVEAGVAVGRTIKESGGGYFCLGSAWALSTV